MNGVVKDAQGAEIPGANITAIHEPSGTNYETVSQGDGRFFIQGMRVGGPYKVAASLAGFTTEVQSSLQLTLGVAQLRSETPSQRNDDRHYYEVLLHSDAHALVRRYHARTAIPREQVGFALTHEVLAKLVSDLAASA